MISNSRDVISCSVAKKAAMVTKMKMPPTHAAIAMSD
ncbi:hypothetical protein SRABI128_04798 [Microbacterium sp. Bi128]|nr:hypothetical protein SRABI128_04798 [Microbacterium sp. Bi128]